MDCKVTHIPYKQTGYYSSLVTDYLDGNKNLMAFYQFSPDKNGIADAITQRQQYSVDRSALVSILHEQYKGFDVSQQVSDNIDAIKQNSTYTICTAHQPNLLTGYLYFIYKIVHTIKLANELNQEYKDKRFVPVYFMGSEDNDLEELGKFKYGGQTYVWEANEQTGAVGRMDTQSLSKLMDELFAKLGPPNDNTEHLKELITKAYLGEKNIATATRHFVNELFGQYGLIIFDPDDNTVKKQMVTVFEDDLLNHTANTLVTQQADALAKKYSAQAYPRNINLFYLKGDIRERIEHAGDNWHVLNNNISWTKDELLTELHDHPEHFSPNVILRGLLQEQLLPNVAFIGGGAEVAYWFQLKPVFEHYKVFYPVILLRQSVLWVEQKYATLQEQLNISDSELFLKEDKLKTNFTATRSNNELSLQEELLTIETQLNKLKGKAINIDDTLTSSADAVITKIKYQIKVLEKKMLRAEKRNMDVDLQRIIRLKQALFPNDSLQERHDNFIGYYPTYGEEFIKTLLSSIEPLKNAFLIVSER